MRTKRRAHYQTIRAQAEVSYTDRTRSRTRQLRSLISFWAFMRGLHSGKPFTVSYGGGKALKVKIDD